MLLYFYSSLLHINTCATWSFDLWEVNVLNVSVHTRIFDRESFCIVFSVLKSKLVQAVLRLWCKIYILWLGIHSMYILKAKVTVNLLLKRENYWLRRLVSLFELTKETKNILSLKCMCADISCVSSSNHFAQQIKHLWNSSNLMLLCWPKNKQNKIKTTTKTAKKTDCMFNQFGVLYIQNFLSDLLKTIMKRCLMQACIEKLW